MPQDKSLSKSLGNRTCFTVNLRDRLACVRCGKQPAAKENYHSGFEYHHVLPRSRGGGDEVGNIALLCRDCHLGQHAAAALSRSSGKDDADIALPPTPEAFACKACAATLDPQTVEMNCGWYRCDACKVQVHLFDHFSG